MTTSNLTLNRPAYCERLEFLGPAELLRIGLDGSGMAPTTAEALLGLTAGDIAAQALEMALKGYVSFVRTGTCSTNDTVTLELVARGVTADAGHIRRIDVRSFSVDDAGLLATEQRYVVTGASTPVVDIFLGDNATESGGSSAQVDPSRTVAAGTEPQTMAFAAGAGTLTATYTGQSGDVTNFRFEVRVFPKVKLTFE